MNNSNVRADSNSTFSKNRGPTIGFVVEKRRTVRGVKDSLLVKGETQNQRYRHVTTQIKFGRKDPVKRGISPSRYCQGCKKKEGLEESN